MSRRDAHRARIHPPAALGDPGSAARLAAARSSAGVAVLVLQRQEAVWMLLLWAGSLLMGVGITLAALPSGAIGVFVLGTAVAGVGLWTECQGSVRTVMARAAAHERAGVAVDHFRCELPGGM
jgi:hypothetical protein